MSKYERALQIKERNERLIKDFENQVYAEKRRDKTGLGDWAGTVEKPSGGGFRRIALRATMSHGSYGSSSCSCDASEDAARSVAATLKEMKSEIIARTVARLREQITEAAKEAAREAREVLAQAEEAE